MKKDKQKSAPVLASLDELDAMVGAGSEFVSIVCTMLKRIPSVSMEVLMIVRNFGVFVGPNATFYLATPEEADKVLGRGTDGAIHARKILAEDCCAAVVVRRKAGDLIFRIGPLKMREVEPLSSSEAGPWSVLSYEPTPEGYLLRRLRLALGLTLEEAGDGFVFGPVDVCWLECGRYRLDGGAFRDACERLCAAARRKGR